MESRDFGPNSPDASRAAPPACSRCRLLIVFGSVRVNALLAWLGNPVTCSRVAARVIPCREGGIELRVLIGDLALDEHCPGTGSTGRGRVDCHGELGEARETKRKVCYPSGYIADVLCHKQLRLRILLSPVMQHLDEVERQQK